MAKVTHPYGSDRAQAVRISVLIILNIFCVVAGLAFYTGAIEGTSVLVGVLLLGVAVACLFATLVVASNPVED